MLQYPDIVIYTGCYKDFYNAYSVSEKEFDFGSVRRLVQIPSIRFSLCYEEMDIEAELLAIGIRIAKQEKENYCMNIKSMELFNFIRDPTNFDFNKLSKVSVFSFANLFTTIGGDPFSFQINNKNDDFILDLEKRAKFDFNNIN
jgi:hypothetical protein